MIDVHARCVHAPRAPFEALTATRRDLGPADVLIDIAFRGVCHSDIHYAHDEFGRTSYPLVPGHEIAGVVSAIGPEVSRFAPGARVGVGSWSMPAAPGSTSIVPATG